MDDISGLECSMKDFASKGHTAMCEVSKWAEWLYDKIPEAFPQIIA